MKTIVELLRFAGVTREPRRRLALYSGLSRSRVGRVLQGRAAPTPDELHRLLALVGGASPPVVTPLILSASRGQDALLRIDGFSCTFQSLTDKREWTRVQTVTGWNKRWHHAKKNSDYRWTCDVGQSFILQREPKFPSAAPYRLEVKAVALADEDALRWRFQHLTRAFDLSQCRTTRLDIAVDLPVAIHDLLVVHPRARKVWPFDDSHSYYFGRRRSGRTIYVYDRTSKYRDGLPHTRIEIRLRPPPVGLFDLLRLRHPFKGVRLFAARIHAGSSEIEALLRHGKSCGGAALRRRLRMETVRVALIDFDSDPVLRFWHPRAVFERRWVEEARWFLAMMTNGERL